MPSVNEIMTTDLEVATPDTSVEAIAGMMRDADCGSIPIVDDDRLVGIVTDRDIVVRCVAEGCSAGNTPCSEVMTRDPITLREHDDVDGALAMMRDHQVRRLPVLDADGRLVGLLAIGKLVRFEDPLRAGEALQGISARDG